jgi:hypothetical protein
MTQCKNKPKTGTHEWAGSTVNIQTGCENNCRYCYAKRMAARFHRISPEVGWEHPEINTTKVAHILESFGKRKGTVMFPSAHDLTDHNYIDAYACMAKILGVGNQLLIVTKPNLAVIRRLCETKTFSESFKDQIEWRLTIGTSSDLKRAEWEPQASTIFDRMLALNFLLEKGFKVSVSCEPLLDRDGTVIDYLLRMFPTLSTIWVGAMQYTKNAPVLQYEEIFQRYCSNMKIKWKDSFVKRLVRTILTNPLIITQALIDEVETALVDKNPELACAIKAYRATHDQRNQISVPPKEAPLYADHVHD